MRGERRRGGKKIEPSLGFFKTSTAASHISPEKCLLTTSIDSTRERKRRWPEMRRFTLSASNSFSQHQAGPEHTTFGAWGRDKGPSNFGALVRRLSGELVLIKCRPICLFYTQSCQPTLDVRSIRTQNEGGGREEYEALHALIYFDKQLESRINPPDEILSRLNQSRSRDVRLDRGWIPSPSLSCWPCQNWSPSGRSPLFLPPFSAGLM